MPFPFRNPINSSYDDSDDDQDVAGKPPDLDENMKPITASNAKPADLDAYGQPGSVKQPDKNPEKPDDAWWRGFEDSFWTGQAQKMMGRSLINVPVGFAKAPFGALSSIGNLIANPQKATDDVLNMPHNIASTIAHAGSDPEAFGELIGQSAFMPIAGKVALNPGEAASGISMAGRGLSNVGGFVARNPRPIQLALRTSGKLADYAGQGVEKIGEKMAGKDVPDLPDVDSSDIDLSTPLKGISKEPTQIISKPGTTPPDKVATLQKTVTNIQDNIDKKYGAGNIDKASPATQKRLADTKAAIPVLNRPGTYITVKSPTPQQIVQAQQLGYQIESKDALGNVRMKQTGRPITVAQSLRNTSINDIDLNAPIGAGGGQ